MSLFAMFKSAGPTGFGYGSTAEQVTEGLSLAGQTILVTGCNSGIGQEACRVLALRGRPSAGHSTHQGEGRGCVRDVSRQGDRLIENNSRLLTKRHFRSRPGSRLKKTRYQGSRKQGISETVMLHTPAVLE